MKTSPAFRLSFAVNVALAAVLAAVLWRDRAEPPPSAPRGASPTPTSAAEPMEQRASPADAGVHPDRISPAVVDQFARLGVTREVLVNALLGDFHRRWDQRVADLEKQYAPRPVPERLYVELAREREAAQVQALKEALGEDGYHAWDRERTLRILNPRGMAMSPHEAEQAYRLQKEFEEHYRDTDMAMEDGVADPLDAHVMQSQASQTLESELEKLLGKERLAAMRGQADPIAEVYQRFGDLNPTSAQADAVVQIEREYQAREAALASRLGQNGADPAGVSAELGALHDAREAGLRAIFGSDSYDTASRQSDPTYKRLKQFAVAWELQDSEIDSVYATLRAYHDEAERARTAAGMSEAAGHPVDWPAVDAAIEEARLQAEAALEGQVGAKRLWRLRENGVFTMR